MSKLLDKIVELQEKTQMTNKKLTENEFEKIDSLFAEIYNLLDKETKELTMYNLIAECSIFIDSLNAFECPVELKKKLDNFLKNY